MKRRVSNTSVCNTSICFIKPEQYRIQICVLSVNCSAKGMFPCSTVECIPSSQTCDGLKQCSNGLDEYCGKQHRASNNVTR